MYPYNLYVIPIKDLFVASSLTERVQIARFFIVIIFALAIIAFFIERILGYKLASLAQDALGICKKLRIFFRAKLGQARQRTHQRIDPDKSSSLDSPQKDPEDEANYE